MGDNKNNKTDDSKSKSDTTEGGESNTDSENDSDEEKIFSLHSINVHGESGELIGLVGAVGSGKSSIVSALLGDMDNQKGSVLIQGSVAYVPQTPWILNSTVKDNILMESPFDEEKYTLALRLSQLEADLEQLPAGEMTQIGEKGITLSGGQKQRVSLARAIYADRDIFILDDPLSALDVHVSLKIFNDAITNHLKDKLVILVTHNIDLLPKCDRIFTVVDGTIAESGDFAKLMADNGEFSKLMKAHSVQENSASKSTDTLEATESEGDKSHKKSSTKEKDGKISKSEKPARGSVKLDVILGYFSAFTRRGRYPYAILIFLSLLFALTEAIQISTNYWLSVWSTDATDGTVDSAMYLGVYAGMTICSLLAYFTVQYSFARGAILAATQLHATMMKAILHAPMAWFDTTPSGRTLSRCSKDVDEADTQLRDSMSSSFRCANEVIGALILISIATGGWLLIACVPVFVCYFSLLQSFRYMSREIKRLDSVSKSPIFNHFAQTLQGLSSIRAYGLEDQFLHKNYSNLDTNNKFYFMSNSLNRWLSVRLELIGSILVFCTAIILTVSTVSPAMAGLGLVYVTQLLSTLGWGVRQAGETEMRLNAIERLLEYQGDDFPAEAESIIEGEEDTLADWPNAGEIEFSDYKMRYRPELPLALKGVNLTIPSGSSVGVCGRTGSGKSSLLVSLFRLCERSGGSIKIDGIDIASIGLHTLRSNMAIIPQDPQMFVGTLRYNLDPFDQYDDAKLWGVLDKVHLRSLIEDRKNQLHCEVAEGGNNFSVGERQLLCIARALLRRPKLIMLDEATASIDRETDAVIQSMIRNEFVDCTLVIIAHRLDTIMDCSHILLLEDGKVGEFGSPKELANMDDGMFSNMVDAAGEGAAARLREIAEFGKGFSTKNAKKVDITSEEMIEVDLNSP